MARERIRLGRRLLAGLFLLNALAFAWIALDLYGSHQSHEAQARMASKNMAQALDQSVTASVEKIDLVLQTSVDFLEERLRAPHAMTATEVNAYFLTQQQRVPDLGGIRACDASGLVIFGALVKPQEKASWASRSFFGILQAGPGVGMVVSDPVLGLVTRQWLVSFARRYNHPDGSFAGVVSASVTVEHLATLLSSMDLGTYGTAVLRDSKQGLIARYPRVEGPTGAIGSKVYSPELLSVMASGERAVTYHALNTSDGVERINTYRRLSNVPFHVVAGIGAPDYLRDFNRELGIAAAQWLLFLLVTSGGAWVVWRAFQRTAQEYERSSTLLHGASDGIHVLDRQGNLVEASDSFFDMLGYTRDEGMVLNVRDWDAQYPHERVGGIVQSLMQEGRTSLVTRHRRKDGSEFPVEVSVLPVTMQGRKLLFASSRDITERMESQSELSELNGSLERLVEERTQELAQALQSAELANRSRGEFLANTSHEIRTPMNSVLGMVYLALKTNTDPQQRKYLERIQRAGVHLMRIIDDILDFSKIDAGKLHLEIAGFSLDHALEQLLQLTDSRAQEKGLSLHLEKDADVPDLLRGDALRIEQILLNFVNNAIKFTERGGVLLKVHCLRCAEGTCDLRFEVVDTGVGLVNDEMSRLFQSFEQGDKTTTRRFGGTGLGLAISRQLAHLMQGEVGVSSSPGMGSTFWFQAQFPIADAVSVPPDSSADLQRAMEALRGKSMLVVDDNEFNLDVARGLLEDLGTLVRTAANGALALEMLQQQRFDCVLMDVQMPVMDGYEATRRIRAHATLAEQVIIAMTANASGSDRLLCLQAGMNEVIKKPIEPGRMYMTLAHWLGGVGAHALAALPLWDALALQKLVGNNPPVQRKLLQTFLNSAAQTVAEMEETLEAQDCRALAAVGHKLKSSARSVGGIQLAALCEALERAGLAGDVTQCQHLAGRVQQAFAALQEHIQAQA